jgi:DNA-directed RNA polymerase specialized sigma24 family protein
MRYGRLSDETLAQMIDRHDSAALSALYDRYAPQAHAVALIVTRDPEAASAVVENLFLEFWRCGKAPSAGSSVRNSLMLSARHLARRFPQPQP